jgi:hypothetical protein
VSSETAKVSSPESFDWMCIGFDRLCIGFLTIIMHCPYWYTFHISTIVKNPAGVCWWDGHPIHGDKCQERH